MTNTFVRCAKVGILSTLVYVLLYPGTGIAHLVLGDRLARVNPQLPKTVGLASIEPENFELMDEAFRSALKSDGWSQAKKIVGNW